MAKKFKGFRGFKKKSLALALTSMLVMGVLVGCGSDSENEENTEQTETVEIGISQFLEHQALDSTREGFIAALEENGYKDGEKINIDLQNAQGESTNTQTIAQSFIADNKDLLLGIGTPSAQALYNGTKETPILITAITDPVDAGLVKSLDSTESNVTGTSDALDLKLQFDLLKDLYPDAKTVGVLYNTGEPNSEVQVKEIKEKAPDFDLEVVTAGVSTSNDVAQSLDSIIDKVDVMYIPTDNVVVAAMPLIYQSTIAKKIPVIGSERSQVENGALATEGIDYYELGFQTGLMAIEIIEGKNPEDMGIKTADEFSLTINEDTVKALGIELPEDLKSRAEMIGSETSDK